jgi:ATP-dependent Clp protease ATP-binding subunit ClpB
VRRRPCAVILDEIEKAHNDVVNVLLQVLDDGRLTDGHGRSVDLRNSLVIMTGHLGSHLVAALSGDAGERLAERTLSLEISEAAVDLLARDGYDPVGGARPLTRLIQCRLQDPIAMAILEGRFRERDTVNVDAAGDALVIGGGPRLRRWSTRSWSRRERSPGHPPPPRGGGDRPVVPSCAPAPRRQIRDCAGGAA